MRLIKLWVMWMLKMIANQILVADNFDQLQQASGEEKEVCPAADEAGLSIRTSIGTLILNASSPADPNGNWLSTLKYAVCLVGTWRKS